MFVSLDGSYGVKKIDMGVNRNINLNWVKDVKITQEFTKSRNGKWIIFLDELSVDFGFNQQGLGIYGQRSVSYRDYVENVPLDDDKFKKSLPVADSIRKSDEYWQENRYTELSDSEEAIYSNLDSLQRVPAFRRNYGYNETGLCRVP